MSFINSLQNERDLNAAQKKQVADTHVTTLRNQADKLEQSYATSNSPVPKYITQRINRLRGEANKVARTTWFDNPKQFKASQKKGTPKGTFDSNRPQGTLKGGVESESVIVTDPASNRTATIAATPENVAAIEAGRQRTVDERRVTDLATAVGLRSRRTEKGQVRLEDPRSNQETVVAVGQGGLQEVVVGGDARQVTVDMERGSRLFPREFMLAEEKGPEPTKFELLAEAPFGVTNQKRTVSQLKQAQYQTLVNKAISGNTFKERAEASILVGEPIGEFMSREGAFINRTQRERTIGDLAKRTDIIGVAAKIALPTSQFTRQDKIFKLNDLTAKQRGTIKTLGSKKGTIGLSATVSTPITQASKLEFKIPTYKKGEADSFSTRLKKTGANVLVATGRGFASPVVSFKREPVTTIASLAAIGVGANIATKSLILGTGISKNFASSLIGSGIAVGFGAFKEIKQPGSVLSKFGAIETATEFGTYAVGIKTATALGKSALTLAPNFIPSVVTTSKGLPPRRSLSQIPIFEGSTRITKGVELVRTAGKRTTFFSSSATRPGDFLNPRIADLVTRVRGGRPKRGGIRDRFFEVEKVDSEFLGPDRAKFNENFFFVSKGEAFTMFGEQGVARLGARTTRTASGENIVRPFRVRFSELFLRSDRASLLRFSSETPSSFSQGSSSAIRRGNFGSKLRSQLVTEVTANPGKIFPGTRTTGLGSGEAEFVIAPGTPIYAKRGPLKFTYDPFTGNFIDVIDVGLKPSIDPALSGTYNFKGRAGNIGQMFLGDVLGVRSFKGLGIEESFKPTRSFRPTNINPLRVRSIPEVGNLRTRTRTSDLFRPRTRERVREVFREPTRTRERTRDRTRERVREVFREPTRTRERTRERIRTRELLRPRERIRTRELLRPRERIRERGRARPLIRTPPRRPPVIIRTPDLIGLGKKKTRKNELGLNFRFLPSLRAGFENIKGTSPKILTGFEVRKIA